MEPGLAPHVSRVWARMGVLRRAATVLRDERSPVGAVLCWERMTEVIPLEEGKRGLRAHAVSPGISDTAMQARIRQSGVEDFPEVERSPESFADALLERVFDAAPPDVVLSL